MVRPEPRQPWAWGKVEVETGDYPGGLGNRTYYYVTIPVSLKSLLEIRRMSLEEEKPTDKQTPNPNSQIPDPNKSKIQENMIRRKTQVSMANCRSRKD